MRKTIVIPITDDLNGLKIKAVLSQSVGLSRREISRLKFTENGILLNGSSAYITAIVQTGDRLEINFPDYDLAHYTRISGKPQILYEDEDLVVVNKPAGMPCHPSHEHLDDDMGTLLQNYYGSSFTIRAVGRLDKDVSGIMLYAKNQPAAARLSRQRTEGLLKKTYTAIAEGILDEKKGILRYRLAKKEGHRDRRISRNGQECVTEYEVIAEHGSLSVLHVSIITGRTHQIRAGMAYAGHPLCGDRLYGGHTEQIPRPALHCSKLVFEQPFTKEQVQIECEPAEDMKRLLG